MFPVIYTHVQDGFWRQFR